jgi:hypothetical protein
MAKTSTTPNNSDYQSKDNQFKTELQTIFNYLKENIATASMVSEVTGIKQKNICRYKRDLECNGALKELYKTNCKVTGFKAWYITTNTQLFPKPNQLNIFNNE